jgi:hypothetical protein
MMGDGASLATGLSGMLGTLRYGACRVLKIIGIATVGMRHIDPAAKKHETGPGRWIGYADDNETVIGQ